MENSYKFFENKACRYYPCHKGLKHINCMFCYCPLYFLDDCGGHYTFTKDGLKDCSQCLIPHKPGGYEYIQKKLKQYFKKKKEQNAT
ncbi:MAG TPA: cysteine-rich small domain-containing protein [Spirochaetota bacterium]|nr:cysteine-rich small domain-containing protein [Spirochaetota bacterium]